MIGASFVITQYHMAFVYYKFTKHTPAGNYSEIKRALTKGSMHIELLKLWNLDNRNKTIIMITHDIEETIFLSDRVVVINDGSEATIKKIVNINLPRPRNKKDIAHDPEYMNRE